MNPTGGHPRDPIIYILLNENSMLTFPEAEVANNTNIFKRRFDQYWQHQDIIYDFRVQIEGTGSRSNVSRVDVV